ncbi:unnamed protein product [Mucor hiemalis]
MMTNDDDENLKDVYKFILDMHLKKSSNFIPSKIILAYLFETFFGRDDHLFIHHWGETMSETCNNNNLKMKLDMRLMMDGSNHITFPFTKKCIRNGDINRLIKAFSLIKHLLSNLESVLKEGGVDDDISYHPSLLSSQLYKPFQCAIKQGSFTEETNSFPNIFNTIDETMKRLNQGTNEERRSKRNKTKATPNTPTVIQAQDSFTVCGLNGSLGYKF